MRFCVHLKVCQLACSMAGYGSQGQEQKKPESKPGNYGTTQSPRIEQDKVKKKKDKLAAKRRFCSLTSDSKMAPKPSFTDISHCQRCQISLTSLSGSWNSNDDFNMESWRAPSSFCHHHHLYRVRMGSCPCWNRHPSLRPSTDPAVGQHELCPP